MVLTMINDTNYFEECFVKNHTAGINSILQVVLMNVPRF